MNLKDLKYLVALADTGHFGRAAERTFVSQPTLSAQLKKLEEYLGVKLVERHPKNVQLTEVGRQIVSRARRMLSEGDANAKRTTSLNAVLTNWLKFDGKNLTPAPFSNGNPQVNGQLDSQFKTQSDMTLKDSLTFRIAAAVVDALGELKLAYPKIDAEQRKQLAAAKKDLEGK